MISAGSFWAHADRSKRESGQPRSVRPTLLATRTRPLLRLPPRKQHAKTSFRGFPIQQYPEAYNKKSSQCLKKGSVGNGFGSKLTALKPHRAGGQNPTNAGTR